MKFSLHGSALYAVKNRNGIDVVTLFLEGKTNASAASHTILG